MAFVTACDQCHQQVIDALDRNGLYEDTLIIFLSDHGELLWIARRDRIFEIQSLRTGHSHSIHCETAKGISNGFGGRFTCESVGCTTYSIAILREWITRAFTRHESEVTI